MTEFNVGRDKKRYIVRVKDTLMREIRRYPVNRVRSLFFNLTGRGDISSGNVFCLALISGILRNTKRQISS